MMITMIGGSGDAFGLLSIFMMAATLHDDHDRRQW